MTTSTAQFRFVDCITVRVVDDDAEVCWRCDASPATTDVGCCRWCLDSLKEPSA